MIEKIFILTLIILTTSVFATSYCIDNSSIIKNMTVNNQLINISQDCVYGCDNITNSCNPNPLEANLLTGVIIGFIIFLGVIIIKWLR